MILDQLEVDPAHARFVYFSYGLGRPLRRTYVAKWF